MRATPVSPDLDARLARATAAVDRHDLAEAHRVLGGLLTEDVPDPRTRCRILIEWAWLRGAQEDYPEAERRLSEAADLADRAGEPSLLCEALRELATVLRYQGDFTRADAVLDRVVGTARSIGNHLEEGHAWFGRAAIAQLRDDYGAAPGMLTAARRAAAALGEAGGQPEQVELLLANICREEAVHARIVRDLDRARTLLTEARERYAAIGRRIGVANALRELGAVLHQVGDFDGARAHYGEAFVAYLRAGRRLGAAAVARRLGHLDAVRGVDGRPDLLDRAERRLRQALRLGRGEPTNHVTCTRLLAQLARLRKRFDVAQRLLDEVTAFLDEQVEGFRPRHEHSAAILERGFLARARGQAEEALTAFTRALDLLDQNADRGPLSIAHQQVAVQLAEAGRLAEALPHAVASFRLNEDDGRRLADPDDRRSFYLDNNEPYTLAMHCAAALGDGRTALTIATAARAEALAAFVRTGARLTGELRELVATIALVSAEPDSEQRLSELYRRLEHTTSTQLRRALSRDPFDVDELTSNLPPGGCALLVDVLDHDDTICVRFWLREGHEPQVDEVVLPESVHGFIARYANASDEAGWEEQHKALAELGAAVVPPDLVEYLLTADAPPPLVVATGTLLGPIPVAAVRVGDRFLAELATLALVPSFPLWTSLRAKPRRSGTGVLVFIDPELPGASRELDALVRFHAPVTSVSAAELRAALAAAERYAAVVINAHGSPPVVEHDVHVDGPARAGLAQALSLSPTDRLTAAELLAASLPDALITASCWSGRVVTRTAAEPFGLPTAALLAGARWVLAGTTDVGGSAGARVMASFYRYLRDLSPAEALHRAQVDYLALGDDAPPAAWASLCVIGDGHAAPHVPEEDPRQC